MTDDPALTSNADSSLAAHWVAMALFGLVGSGVLAATAEYARYYSLMLLAWDKFYLPQGAALLLFCLVWAKSLVLLAPLMALSALISWAGWRRSARAVFLIGALLLCFWLIVDVRVHAMTHNHVLSYAVLLRNPHAFETGGGLGPLLAPFVKVFLLALACAAALAVISELLARWLLRASPVTGRLVYPIFATALFLSPILAVALGSRQFRAPMLLAQLSSELPVNMAGIGPPSVDSMPAEQMRLRASTAVLRTYERLFARLCRAAPLDESVRLDLASPPNVILIVVESWRHEALGPRMMPRLNAWADKGLRMDHHYSAADNSHAGVFSLLYGRSPLVYYQTLDAGLIPQLCLTLRNSGYRTAYVGTASTNWQDMDAFLNERAFEELSVIAEGPWWRRDIQAIGRLQRLLREHAGRPQFILLGTMTTHFPYETPPGYEIFKPVGTFGSVAENVGSEHRQELMNGYMNCARFTDDKLADLIEGLDPRRNLVIITGDHGETLFDDGTLGHWNRLSDIETRVPMAIVGPGAPPRRLSRWTSHTDLLPTLLHILAGKPAPVAHCPGRDLLAPAQDTDHAIIWTLERYRWPWRFGVLVEPEGRMMFKAFTDTPRFIILGRCDERGNLDIMRPLTEQDLAHWQRSFEEQLARLAR